LKPTPKKELSLFDCTSLIVGIIIGAGVYQMAPDIAKGVGGPSGVLAIWMVGGLLSLCGALGYAELATAYPREGGDFVYLSRAYGRWAGFLFGWIQLAVVRPGDIVVMAFAFAMYARPICDPLVGSRLPYAQQALASAAVIALTIINIVGVRAGKWTQNLLTSVKVLGLLAIVGVAIFAPENSSQRNNARRGHWKIISLTDGGADRVGARTQASVILGPHGAGRLDLTNVDGLQDVKCSVDHSMGIREGLPVETLSFEIGQGDRRRIGGQGWATVGDKNENRLTGTISTRGNKQLDFSAERLALPASLALIFVLFTFGGWNEMAYVAAEVKNPGRNIVRTLLIGTATVTVLYVFVNGAFLCAVGYYGLTASDAVAADTVSVAFPTVGSQLISALICISALGAVNGLIFTGARISYAVGGEHRAFRILGDWDHRTGTPVRALLVQALIALVLIAVLGSFVDTLLYTAAPVYLFYLATSLAVIVLRVREPGVVRPYRVTGYPVPTIVFAAVCLFLITSAVRYKPQVAVTALVILLAGLPIYWLSDRTRVKQR